MKNLLRTGVVTSGSGRLCDGCPRWECQITLAPGGGGRITDQENFGVPKFLGNCGTCPTLRKGLARVARQIAWGKFGINPKAEIFPAKSGPAEINPPPPALHVTGA